MSPHAVNSFVTDLVAMAQAMERVPQLESDINRKDTQIEEYAKRVLELELSLEAKTIYATGLEQKVHNAEVARDDAEMRFLELDEKTHQVLGMLIDFEGKAKGARLILDPPQPTPVVEPTPTVPTTVEGQSEADPTALASPQDLSQTATTVPEQVGAEANPPPEVTQPQADPTTMMDAAPADIPQDTAPHTSETVSTPEPGPYACKFYYDEPRFVPLEVWLAGGGTVYSYHWRPEKKHLY